MPWTPDEMPSLAGKTAIVTGANGGIGFHTARLLAIAGARVIMACRNMEKADRALAQLLSECPEAKAVLYPLDLSDLDNVKAFCSRFREEHEQLDLLINNAGIMFTPHTLNRHGHEVQFATNHLGHFALTGQLIDRLSQAPSARVVNVASLAHRWGKIRFDDLHGEKSYNKWGAYGQTKLANLLFTHELDKRLTAAGLSARAMAAHPGFSATDITRESNWMHKAMPLAAQSAEVGSWATLRAATDPDAAGNSYWGPRWCFQIWGAPKEVGRSRRAQDAATASRLWEISEALTGTRYPLPTIQT